MNPPQTKTESTVTVCFLLKYSLLLSYLPPLYVSFSLFACFHSSQNAIPISLVVLTILLIATRSIVGTATSMCISDLFQVSLLVLFLCGSNAVSVSLFVLSFSFCFFDSKAFLVFLTVLFSLGQNTVSISLIVWSVLLSVISLSTALQSVLFFYNLSTPRLGSITGSFLDVWLFVVLNYNVLAAAAAAEEAVVVEGFGLFGFDTAAFEPSLCLD